MVEEKGEIGLKDVDVVTTATRAIMSGTYAVLSFPLAAPGSFIRASSASGTAGYFDNLTVVESDSSVSKPQLRLRETQDGDYARLEFQAASRPYWHIAVGGGAAQPRAHFARLA